jgi:hypothetical protein
MSTFVLLLICIVIAYVLAMYASTEIVSAFHWVEKEITEVEAGTWISIFAFLAAFIIFYSILPSSKRERKEGYSQNNTNKNCIAEATDTWKKYDIPSGIHKCTFKSEDSVLLKAPDGREFIRLRDASGYVQTYTTDGAIVTDFGWMQDWYFFIKKMPGVRTTKTVWLE